MVPGELCWTFCNMFQKVVFQADLAQFCGCLVRVLHHLKYLALVICGSWGYGGHIATGFKWLRLQLILIKCLAVVVYYS